MPTLKKTVKPRAKTMARKPVVAKTETISYNRYDRLFIALALFAFVAVGFTIAAFRSYNLYQAKTAASQLDATPLIFERHANLAPNCGSDPMVTMPECNSD